MRLVLRGCGYGTRVLVVYAGEERQMRVADKVILSGEEGKFTVVIRLCGGAVLLGLKENAAEDSDDLYWRRTCWSSSALLITRKPILRTSKGELVSRVK